MTRTAAGLPLQLTRVPLRTVRPRDIRAYTQPSVQIMRLEGHGLLHRLAHGYYAVVPPDRVGGDWKPTLEGAAAGIAAADFGPETYALMGIAAARLHRALPRAVAVATVAAPRRRRDLALTDRKATIHFLPRDIDKIPVERMPTDLGPCLVTTPEQTVLDLAHLPRLGDVEADAWDAIDALLPRCADSVLDDLAGEQRLNSALRRVRARARDRARASAT